MQTTSTTGTRATTRPRWTKQDTTWALSLFGTAVGAGILFLPINAGMSGFWPLVVMTLLVGPMTFFCSPWFVTFCALVQNRRQRHH